MNPDATTVVGNLEALGNDASAAASSGNFMDHLPDSMKLDLGTIVFVMVLVTVLFIFMKYVCFKPIVKVIDDRAEAIKCGVVKLAEAKALIEQHQSDYAARLHELRMKANEHRKALSVATAQTKKELLDKARIEANEHRVAAISELDVAKEAAKVELLVQVEALSEFMVQHLIGQA